MKRLMATCILVLFVGIAQAETIPVTSGEHADFSRIVFQFPALEDWEFGRVSGGYELRTFVQDAIFDLTQVYSRIPRTRIAEIYSPGSGRIFFSVPCDCTGDVFEIREGRIVVDIKDGSPGANAQYETPLEDIDQRPVSDSSSQPIQIDFPTQIPATANWPGFGEPYETDTPGALLFPPANVGPGNATTQSIGLPLAEPPLSPMPPNNSSGKTSEGTGSEANASTKIPLDLSIAGPVGAAYPLDRVATAKVNDGQRQRGESDRNETNNLPLLPVWPADPFGEQFRAPGEPSLKQQETAMETLLLGQLSRAASQGLITIPPPDISQAVPYEPKPSQNQMAPPEVLATQPYDPPLANLRMETAADRGQSDTNENLILTSQGGTCLEPEIMDVATWGNPKPFLAPLGRLRTGIVEEFDTPNVEAIQGLVQRYIFLGFGAEAKLLLQSFQVEIPNSDILMQLAEIMDDGAAHSKGRLIDQISCDRPTALWAVLAAEKIPAGEHIDKKSVVLAFSSLPSHLRTHLGPWLTQRFLDYGDAETATKIRDLMDRAPGRPQSGSQLAHAQLASADGSTFEQLAYLEAAIVENGAHSAEALAELIETKLQLGQTVSEQNALLASAMAVENRDSEIGRRLTRASIRAFAVGGQIEMTFAQIFDAKDNGYISESEAQDLLVETHLRNTQISPNASFLSNFYRFREYLAGESDKAVNTRFLTANRLVELGFSNQAMALVGKDDADKSEAGRRLRARAFLDQGDPKTALSWVAGLEEPESRKLEAHILTEMGDYAAAATIYRALKMESALESAAWLAGDWQDVIAGSNPDRAAVVRLFSENRLGEDTSQVNPESPAKPDRENSPLLEGNLMIARSSEARQALSALLFNVQ